VIVGRDCCLPLGPRGFRTINLAAIDALFDINVVVVNVFPLEPDDFPGAHSRENGKANEKLLAWTERPGSAAGKA
jgi:hypothetical protein